MVIPVYMYLGDFVCNSRNHVTGDCKSKETEAIHGLHNSNGIINMFEDLCNSQSQGNHSIQENSYAVTKVTGQKNKNYWLDRFEEKAAIYEYEANMTRLDAEEYAIYDLVNELIETNEKKDWDEAMRYLFACGVSNPYWK